MRDISQIQVITGALSKEKDKYLHELGRINASIEKKIATINKMQAYQNEYDNSENLQLSRTVPALNQNIYMFSKVVFDVICQAETEVVSLKKIKDSLLETIKKIDNKIDLMNHFNDRLKFENKARSDKLEQSLLDDLVATERSRGGHE